MIRLYAGELLEEVEEVAPQLKKTKFFIFQENAATILYNYKGHILKTEEGFWDFRGKLSCVYGEGCAIDTAKSIVKKMNLTKDSELAIEVELNTFKRKKWFNPQKDDYDIVDYPFDEIKTIVWSSKINCKMEREIKFRVWDEKATKMFSWDEIGEISIKGCLLVIDIFFPCGDSPKLTKMQYTGMKDKNGKEIYEGDILDCIYLFDGCDKHKLEVVWDNNNASYELKNIGECHQPNVLQSMWDMTRSVVIGNIYENPNLLP